MLSSSSTRRSQCKIANNLTSNVSIELTQSFTDGSGEKITMLEKDGMKHNLISRQLGEATSTGQDDAEQTQDNQSGFRFLAACHSGIRVL